MTKRFGLGRFGDRRLEKGGPCCIGPCMSSAPRVAGRDIVVVQDTTELNLGGRRARANGYMPIGKGGAVRGLVLHVGLAVELATGAVIGLADAQVWNRDK